MVFIFEVNFIQGLIDSLVVLALDTLHERSDQSQIATSLHDLDSLGQIHLIRQGLQQPIQMHGLFFQIEHNRLVVEFLIAYLLN